MIRNIIRLSILALLVSCGGDDGPPPPPEGALLVFPEENSECTTGTDINQTSTQITFRWMASDNTDTYTLSVVNLDTNVPQNISTATTSASLTITKGTPFAWTVTSRNSESDQWHQVKLGCFTMRGHKLHTHPFPPNWLTQHQVQRYKWILQMRCCWNGPERMWITILSPLRCFSLKPTRRLPLWELQIHLLWRYRLVSHLEPSIIGK